MSCYRKQIVLRIPADRVGIHDREAFERFELDHPGVLDYEVGHLSYSLASTDDRRFFDYWLYDEVMPYLCALDSYQRSRSLTSREKDRYREVFRTLSLSVDMDDVRRCEYVWYDGIEAPACD
ncbi:MAG: hypothetical protein ABS888_08900 [Eubacteriales bacterium]